MLLALDLLHARWSSGCSWNFASARRCPTALVERLEAAIRDKKFQDAYDACKDNDSFLARLVRTGIANLPNGRPEAKEAMQTAAEEIVTTMEMKISYLAIIGTLGPMIGLVGTIWGMIMSFQEIATAAGAQPRPEKVAEGISTALFITLEGVIAVGPGDLLLRLLPQSDRSDDHGSDPRRRSHDQLPGRRGQGRQAGLSQAGVGGGDLMAASMTSELKAEPNLTPLLDVVFQLITFFMLVINFSSENYDQRVRLPVAESARPIDDEQRVSEDRLVLNVDSEGHLLIGGEVQPLHKAIQTIKHQADLVRLNLKAAGAQSSTPTASLPTTIIFRADRDATFGSLISLIKACQSNGFRKFALKAMNS